MMADGAAVEGRGVAACGVTTDGPAAAGEGRGAAGATSSTDGAASDHPEPCTTAHGSHAPSSPARPRSIVGYVPRGHALASAPEAGGVAHSSVPASTTFDASLYPSLQTLPVDEPMEPDEQPDGDRKLYRPSGHANPGEAAARSPEEMVYLPENYPSLAPKQARAPPLYTPNGHAVPPRADEAETEGGEGEPLGVAQVEVSILPSSGRTAAEPPRRIVWAASALRRRAGKALGRACGAIARTCCPTLKQKHDGRLDGRFG